MHVLRKSLIFAGRSLADLRTFPADARRAAGHQLDQVQRGDDPDDWKPMKTVGPGVREIRIRSSDGAFRILYIAEWAGRVLVLHCFQKKSARTSRHDVALASRRYRQAIGGVNDG
ncbi:MAG: type II toxin-antitoxin system RelE/ParE family toxin [Algiphilus sp.]